MKPLFLLFVAVLLTVSQATAGIGLNRREQKESYYVKVSISQCTLTLYANGESGLVPVRKYRVGTAVKGLEVYPLGKGKITRIELNPWWHPTQYTREIYHRLKNIELPEAVPPGAPENYMGSFKIHLSHATERGRIYRIHGNNNPKRVGRRVTGGCICMDNDEGLELAKTIPEGTVVEIVM